MYDLKHLKTRKEVSLHYEDSNNFDKIIEYIQSEEGLIENPTNAEFFNLEDDFTTAWVTVLMCGDKVFSFEIGIDVTHDSSGTAIESIEPWFDYNYENNVIILDELSEYDRNILIDFLDNNHIKYEIK